MANARGGGVSARGGSKEWQVQGVVARSGKCKGWWKGGWVQGVVERSGECKGGWMRDGTRSGSKKGECKGCGKRRCKGWKEGWVQGLVERV